MLSDAMFPEWIEPMAATLTQERFTGAEWSFERKLDGIRLIAFKQGKSVRLYSRTRKEKELPRIAVAVAALPVDDVVLDGEVTWDGHTGYHVFDVVWIGGRDVTHLTLTARRALLAEFPMEAPLYRVAELDDVAPWERACAEGWEGVIAKRRDSTYEHRRSKHWLKMKCELTHDFVVGGFTDGQGSRVGLGALLVGYFEDDDFVFAVMRPKYLPRLSRDAAVQGRDAVRVARHLERQDRHAEGFVMIFRADASETHEFFLR